MRGHELRTQTNANHTTPAMAKHTVKAPLGSQATLGANDGPPAGSSPMIQQAASRKSHTKLAAKHPISSIALYSPNKKSANQSDAYSTLYPDTSSDSASGKSNGLRFVSPNAARNQHPARSGQTAANITILCPVSPVKTESRTVPVNATSNINRKLRHTSYAAAWLTARKLPSKPNLPLPAKLPDSTMPHGPMVLNNHNRSMPSQ